MIKKTVICVLLLFTSLLCRAPGYPTFYIKESKGIQPYEIIWKAICTIESSGDSRAWNKRESAVGICQIRPIKLKDFNDQTGKHYKLSQMYEISKSKEVFIWFARKHQPDDYEGIAKDWNCQSEKYWQKVKTKI